MALKLAFFTHYGGEKVSRSRFLASAKKNVLILKSAASADFCIDLFVTSCEPFVGDFDNSIKVLLDNKLLEIIRWSVLCSPSISRILCLFLLPLQMLRYRLFNDKPNLFAFYNTLASESVGLLMVKLFYPDTPCILFYDDDLRARYSQRRMIDLLCWSFAKRFANLKHVYAVNNFLAAEISHSGIPNSILPCIVDTRQIIEKPNYYTNRRLRICYSGGLEPEKGADLIFELGRNLPKDYCLDITGKGSMQSNFYCLSGEVNNVSYHGCLEENDLISLYLSSDVFLCLHTHMPGVFPFKIIEALYHGMVVISTPIDLPVWLSSIDGLFIMPRSPNSTDCVACLLDYLASVVNYLQIYSYKISFVQDIIEANCSFNSLGLQLKSHISAPRS